MSAFLCDSYHVGRVAAYLAHVFGGPMHEGYLRAWCPSIMERNDTACTQDLCEVISHFLAVANMNSLDARYDDGAAGFLGGQHPGGYINECRMESRKPYMNHVHDDAQMFQAITCLEYQSCEAPGWYGSDTLSLLMRGQLAAGRRMARRLGAERMDELERPAGEAPAEDIMSLVGLK